MLDKMVRERTMSKVLYQRACEVTTGGVHSNIRYMKPHPIFFSTGKGSRIYDVDDNEYIDLIVNYGALILGHGDIDVIEAVKKQLETGLTAGIETELSVETAKLLTGIVPCAEKVRFSNTGTEAVMHALQIARGYTGREKIIKAEGNYHGWYDSVFCSYRYPEGEWRTPQPVPTTGGLNTRHLQDTLVVPWNDLDAMERVIHQFGNETAAVIIEPVNHNIGCALPKEGYLEGVRKLTKDFGIILIFDEVISGFRSAPGGAQEYFNVVPDIATFAKAVANGFSLSVVAGKSTIMECTSPVNNIVAFGGTYNGSQPALAAAKATLMKLKTGDIQKHLNNCTDILVRAFREFSPNYPVEARLQGFGGKFQIYFNDKRVDDWRSASRSNQEIYAVFRNFMVNHGVLWVSSPFSHNGLTAAHSEDDVRIILQTMEKGLAYVSKEGVK